jgi:hypothetical protein
MLLPHDGRLLCLSVTDGGTTMSLLHWWGTIMSLLYSLPISEGET